VRVHLLNCAGGEKKKLETTAAKGISSKAAFLKSGSPDILSGCFLKTKEENEPVNFAREKCRKYHPRERLHPNDEGGGSRRKHPESRENASDGNCGTMGRAL